MRMMCVRLPRGIESGHASVDTMGALATWFYPIQPSVALWLRIGIRVRPCHGVWRVSVSMSNVARMHAMEVPWASSLHLCALAFHTPRFEL